MCECGRTCVYGVLGQRMGLRVSHTVYIISLSHKFKIPKFPHVMLGTYGSTATAIILSLARPSTTSWCPESTALDRGRLGSRCVLFLWQSFTAHPVPQGFDKEGAQQLKHKLVDTSKWIGTAGQQHHVLFITWLIKR